MNESAGEKIYRRAKDGKKFQNSAKQSILKSGFRYHMNLPFPIFFLEKSIFVSLYLFAAALGNLFSQVYGS